MCGPGGTASHAGFGATTRPASPGRSSASNKNNCQRPTPHPATLPFSPWPEFRQVPTLHEWQGQGQLWENWSPRLLSRSAGQLEGVAERACCWLTACHSARCAHLAGSVPYCSTQVRRSGRSARYQWLSAGDSRMPFLCGAACLLACARPGRRGHFSRASHLGRMKRAGRGGIEE